MSRSNQRDWYWLRDIRVGNQYRFNRVPTVFPSHREFVWNLPDDARLVIVAIRDSQVYVDVEHWDPGDYTEEAFCQMKRWYEHFINFRHPYASVESFNAQLNLGVYSRVS